MGIQAAERLLEIEAKPEGELREWLRHRGIAELECLLGDMNGVLRGKVVPASWFSRGDALRLPSSVLSVMLTGNYASPTGDESAWRDPDMVLRPDGTTVGLTSRRENPTAFVFVDACHPCGRPWAAAPRQVLKSVLSLYAARGWRAVLGVEIEFYLSVQRRAASPASIEALRTCSDVLVEIDTSMRAAGLALEGLSQESGAGQLELNLPHGDPMRRSDETLIFKRLVREAAASWGTQATFMAKPLEGQAPSGMHLHVSLESAASGQNLFAAEGSLFSHFIGGLQSWLPEIAPLYAPSANSFRRMRPRHSAPTNVEWGHDNRSCGLRIPLSGSAHRRIEVRLPGADANPYLATAAVLLSGYLGLDAATEPGVEMTGNAYLRPRTLPLTLEEALGRFRSCPRILDLLGDPFVSAFLAVKDAEVEAFQAEITPWEREHLS